MRGSIEMVPISTILDTLRFFKVFFIGTREPRETRVVLISLRQKMIKEMKRRGFNEARLKKMIE